MWIITIKDPLTSGVGLLGNIISFLVTLSPMPTILTICKMKTTGSFDSLPYIVSLFSAMSWLYYALLNFDVLLLTINSLVCIIQSIYIGIYLLYAPVKRKTHTLKMLFLLNVGIYGSLVLISIVFLHGKTRQQIAGGVCASFAAAVFMAPLNIIKLVIKTKSVRYMPFSLSFFLTLSAIAWLSYGLLRHDMFVALPNVLGFLFGMAQMIVYFIYMNSKASEETKPNDYFADAAAGVPPSSPGTMELPDMKIVNNSTPKEKPAPAELSTSESNV